MEKRINRIIWTVTAIVLLVFSDFLVKNSSAAAVVNIIGCLILLREFMIVFKGQQKKVMFWGYVGETALLVCVLIDLAKLSL